MDGVIVDCMTSIISLMYGEGAVEPILRGWPKGVYGLEPAIGQSEERIWEAVRREGSEFWRNMDAYPWAHPLVNLLRVQGDLVFLSSPTRAADSAKGKIQWLADNFSFNARDYILTPAEHKFRLANKTAILIDDSQDNCDAWRDAGGEAVVFPRPWNDVLEPDCSPTERAQLICKRVIEFKTKLIESKTK